MIFIIVISTSISLCIFLLIRNNQVEKFRYKIINEIGDLAKDDLDQGLITMKWRVSVYKLVSYEKMLLQMWKPLTAEAFYDDLTFLKPSNEIELCKYPQIRRFPNV